MWITDATYLSWQKRLSRKSFFRFFWLFWGLYAVLFFYFGILLLFLPQWRRMAILAGIAYLLARFVINEIVNLFYKKKRPYQQLNFVPLSSRWLMSPIYKSFKSLPSGHAASMVALSTVCYVFYPPLGSFWFGVTLLSCAGRVVLGYHYFTDILAGWVVGLISALLVLGVIAPSLYH